MIDVDTSSFFAIVTVAALAAVTVVVVPSRFAPPVVVLELVMGIAIGPQVLHLAHSDDFIAFFSNLGLGMLFYFAGYEIDFERIEGKPLRLGAAGWALSVALAYGIGGALAAAGIVVSFRRRPGRRRDALDPDLPLRRPGHLKNAPTRRTGRALPRWARPPP